VDECHNGSKDIVGSAEVAIMKSQVASGRTHDDRSVAREPADIFVAQPHAHEKTAKLASGSRPGFERQRELELARPESDQAA